MLSPSTSSSDDKNIVSSWPASECPTLNTSFPSSDPHPYHSSMLHHHSDETQHHIEWNSLFSAPLNPSVFATLAANGVFPVPRPDHHHSRHYTEHSSSSSWSHAPTSISGHLRPSLSRVHSSSQEQPRTRVNSSSQEQPMSTLNSRPRRIAVSN